MHNMDQQYPPLSSAFPKPMGLPPRPIVPNVRLPTNALGEYASIKKILTTAAVNANKPSQLFKRLMNENGRQTLLRLCYKLRDDPKVLEEFELTDLEKALYSVLERITMKMEGAAMDVPCIDIYANKLGVSASVVREMDLCVVLFLALPRCTNSSKKRPME